MNVAFIIYKRPDLTRRVFDAIRQARPQRLFVVADGPRTTEEAEKCREARAVTERIDWSCDVRRNYSETNLGCRRRVSSGLDWVFEQVEDVIILEDDCLPHPSFFRYAAELLARYAYDKRVMHISGANLAGVVPSGRASYCFVRYPHVWGWATWRRAWVQYDAEMKEWPEYRLDRKLSELCSSSTETRYWKTNFQSVYERKVDTWDFIWVFSCWRSRGLCVLPSVSLVSNIGFAKDALHTRDEGSVFSCQPVYDIGQLIHPGDVVEDKRVSRIVYKTCYAQKMSSRRAFSRLFNRWAMGKLFRGIPLLGRLWAAFRGISAFRGGTRRIL